MVDENPPPPPTPPPVTQPESKWTPPDLRGAFWIAIVILVIYGLSVVGVLWMGRWRDDANYIKDAESLTAIYSGWIATIITFYFGQASVANEKKNSLELTKTQEIQRFDMMKTYEKQRDILTDRIQNLEQERKALIDKIK
jgi:hypothetical protein